MRATIDANVLLRAVTKDPPQEALLAAELLERADILAIPLVSICEMVWVLKRLYKKNRRELGDAVRHLLQIEKTRLDRPAIEAGLAFLEAGGDFSDGVIAFEGRRLEGETFVTFDRKAASVLKAANKPYLLLRVDDRA